MEINELGEPVFTSKDLFQEIYKGNLSKINLSKIHYSTDIDYLSYIEFVQDNNLKDWPLPEPYFGDARTKEEYDSYNQNIWYMPEQYNHFDIETYLLSLCKTIDEETRVKEEIELYKKNNLLSLLRFLKFLVDTMREHNILWGVGRGSSVASYCLYLLGIHKINSIKYELDIREFLR